MSRIIDYQDRATCVLFGDGAGAMLLEPTADGEDAGFIDFLGEIDGSGGHYLYMPAGGSRTPASAETVAGRMHYVHQEGQQVFKYAVRNNVLRCPPRSPPARNRSDHCRYRHLDSASGQSPHHRCHHGTAGAATRKSDGEHRPLRQHHGRNHSARDVRRIRRRTPSQRRTRGICRCRRRLHRRR